MIKLSWKVLRYNSNTEDFEYFNIFQNIVVYESTIKLCKEYKKGRYTFDEFVKKLDDIIKFEEWSRFEYEISVTDLFGIVTKKVDCYSQAHANIELIAKYIIGEYNNEA